MNPPQILVTVALDPSVERVATEVVECSPRIDEVRHLRELNGISIDLAKLKPYAVLVDIDSKPEEILADLQDIIDTHPNVTFIVVATEQRAEWVLKAMHVGARDFLAKASMSSTLPGVLDRINQTSRNAHVDHTVVSVLAASGGCGATMLAVNLTHELFQMTDAPALLIDLDSMYGGATECLSLKSDHGVADVLSDSDRIDSHLIRSTAVGFKNKWHILASSRASRGSYVGAADYQHIPRMLRAAQGAFAHTVVDAPRMTFEVGATLARASTMTFIVLEANVVDVRAARHLLDELRDGGADLKRVRPVVNRFRNGKSVLSYSDVRKALGLEDVKRLSNDFKSVISSINYGKTLADVAPRSTLRREIVHLARELSPTR